LELGDDWGCFLVRLGSITGAGGPNEGGLVAEERSQRRGNDHPHPKQAFVKIQVWHLRYPHFAPHFAPQRGLKKGQKR
jgi:hypothetical protein